MLLRNKIFILSAIFILLFPKIVFANEMTVKLSKCVDGDTAKFIYKQEIITARFLAIDTPETTKGKNDPWGMEASQYTCDALLNANKIVLETDKNSDEKDRYNRYLVWVFVDNELLQSGLIEEGYAKVAYLYGDYKYTSILQEQELIARNNKVGIHSNETTFDYKTLLILGGFVLVIYVFFKDSRVVIKKQLKKLFKKSKIF